MGARSPMARYLIVADQTATSPELLAAGREIAQDDPGGAGRARPGLEEAGAGVIQAKVGDASPLLAIADEMRAQPEYDAVVISTFPLGLSRGLRLGLPRRVRQ